MIDAINTRYVALLVVKTLPVLLIGNASKIKLIVAANKNKFSKVLSFKNLNLFIIKKANKNPIISMTENPKIPASVKISR